MEMTEKEARDKVGPAFRDLARTTKLKKQTTVAAEQRMGATSTRITDNMPSLP